MKHTYPYSPKEPSENVALVWAALLTMGVIILAFIQFS